MKYPAKSQTLPSIAKTLTNEGYVADMLYGGDINFTNMQSYSSVPVTAGSRQTVTFRSPAA